MKDKHNPIIDQLVDVIHEGIARRGFYVLLDERKDLICGEPCEEDLRRHRKTFQTFARAHGWLAALAENAVTFSRAIVPQSKRPTSAVLERKPVDLSDCWHQYFGSEAQLVNGTSH
jgi:hypothetical protein